MAVGRSERTRKCGNNVSGGSSANMLNKFPTRAELRQMGNKQKVTSPSVYYFSLHLSLIEIQVSFLFSFGFFLLVVL